MPDRPVPIRKNEKAKSLEVDLSKEEGKEEKEEGREEKEEEGEKASASVSEAEAGMFNVLKEANTYNNKGVNFQ
jgi:mRNA deadenylase 3'-5' endonuclease subunit Ccr4